MIKSFFYVILLSALIVVCCSDDVAEKAGGTGLRKISHPSESQLKELDEAGADIIVRETDYIIVRTTAVTTPLSVISAPIEEKDLVQRLVHIYLADSASLQMVINSGVDFWGVEGDTAVARAYDIYIDDLLAAGMTVRIVAQNAAAWLEGQE